MKEPDNEYHSTSPSALYAFSADPITYGHINIVERIAACFPHCIVGIGRNPLKKYLFNIEQRKHLAESALAHLPNVEVRVFEGMVVDFAFENGIKVIIKGVRSATDMDYEQTLHQVGVSQKLGIDTHILFAAPHLAHVSSSVVKAMLIEQGFIQDYVPPIVKAALEAKLLGQLVIGLTGDIASGKSYLANKLIEAGTQLGTDVHNIDLDALGHQLLAGENIGEPMYREIVDKLVGKFGNQILVDDVLYRPKLAEAIFENPSARRYLNKILENPMAILLRRALKGLKGVIILNGALLADLGLLGLCNYRTILCNVEPSEQSRRLADRYLNDVQINSRLEAQLRGNEKLNLISQTIKEHSFGQIWQYGTSVQKLSPKQLLSSILDGCNEYQGENKNG